MKARIVQILPHERFTTVEGFMRELAMAVHANKVGDVSLGWPPTAQELEEQYRGNDYFNPLVDGMYNILTDGDNPATVQMLCDAITVAEGIIAKDREADDAETGR